MKWIKIADEIPKPEQSVFVVLDYTSYGRGRRVETAQVHFTNENISYGGPNSLTGRGTLTGTFFSLPAIVKPGIVTHWMPLPDLPND